MGGQQRPDTLGGDPRTARTRAQEVVSGGSDMLRASLSLAGLTLGSIALAAAIGFAANFIYALLML